MLSIAVNAVCYKALLRLGRLIEWFNTAAVLLSIQISSTEYK